MNVGDLGQDLEHCLQLRKQLHMFRGVWAGVRGPSMERAAGASPHWEIKLRVVTRQGLWSLMWALVSAPHLLPARA